MKSKRINLLVTPEEKSFIDERAKKAGITTSELVRQAVVSFDPEIDMEELRALSEQMAIVIEQTEKSWMPISRPSRRCAKNWPTRRP